MVVCIDKATAVRMYDKVQKYWKAYLKDLRARLKEAKDADEREGLAARVKFMQETDMAVVVSQSQNEVEEMREEGRGHHARTGAGWSRRTWTTKFKDPDDPFRIVFVCAMWMTGFDVPCCSTIYLDKPMRNHTLMQTIARANRVFRDKVNGLIVDYVGRLPESAEGAGDLRPGRGGGRHAGAGQGRAGGASCGRPSRRRPTFCRKLGIRVEKLLQAKGLHAGQAPG